MKICAIQQPYPYTPEEAAAAVQFVIDELDSCDESIDLIVTPEYVNCPSKFPAGESLPFAIAHTAELVQAAINAARRCRAVVALSFCAEVDGVYRNTTRIFDRNGNVAGDYYKQQLVNVEPVTRGVDNSYTLDYLPPAIVEVDGVRYGFVICYDAYFEEYIEHLAYRKPDVVLVSSHQRGERFDVLEFLNSSLAFHTNAFVVRASVGMGENKSTGGSSMVVDPSGRILANARSRNGKLICEVEDIHWKYQRSDSFGGTMINNDWFIEKGRTPWSYRPAGSSVRPDNRRMPYPRVCAHRGFCQIAPENSLPAFGAAIALGADEIELDLRQTADGVPVVIHDSVLERVSNGTGDISGKTLAELKELDFGSKSGTAFAGLKIAAFEEVLKRFPRQTIFNVHIKSPDSASYLQKIVQLIRDYDCLDHVYVAGGGEVMEAMREVAPSIPRCLIIGHNPERIDVVSIAVRYSCAKIQFMKPWLDREMIEKAHANDIRCNLFWCDDPAEAAEYLALGVDTILTNNYWQIARIVHPGIGG